MKIMFCGSADSNHGTDAFFLFLLHLLGLFREFMSEKGDDRWSLIRVELHKPPKIPHVGRTGEPA